MNGERLDLKAELQALADEAAQSLSVHLTPGELITYNRGEMSAEDEERVQNHLAVCQDCVALLLDLEKFKAWTPEGEHRLSAVEVADLWREMQPKLQAVREESGLELASQQEIGVAAQIESSGQAERRKQEELGLRSGWRERFRALFSSPRISYAMAASLLILSLGLGTWIVLTRREHQQQMAQLSEQLTQRELAIVSAKRSLEEAQQKVEEASRRSGQNEAQIAKLQRDLDELSQPQLNVPVEDLRPREFIRGKETWKIIEIPSGANLFTLILTVSRKPSYAGYQLEVRNRRGKVVWHGAGLQKNANGYFTVALPRRLIPPGRYRMRIYGLGGGPKRLVEEYAVQIRHQ